MNYRHLALILIVLLAFILRIHPAFIGSIMGPDSYFHFRMAELIQETGWIPEYDELSDSGRYYSYLPILHISIAIFSMITTLPVPFAAQLLVAISGSIGVIVIYFIGKEFFNEKIALFAAFALALTGLHITRTGGMIRPDGLAMLVIPLVIYFVYTQKYKYAGILSVILALLSKISSLYLAGFLLFWTAVSKFYKKDVNRAAIMWIVVLMALTYFLWFISLPYSINEFFSNYSFSSAEMSYFSLLSILFYFSFPWFFAIVGIAKVRSPIFLKIWILYSVLFALPGVRLGLFVTMPVALFAGAGIYFIYERISPYRKVFFAFVLILAFIVSANELRTDKPYMTFEEQNAVMWIEENTPDDAIIAARWDRGHPITYLADRKVVMDGYFEFAPDLEKRYNSINTLISSSNCRKIQREIDKFSADYFFIPVKDFRNYAYINGILEAKECPNISKIYHSDGGMLMSYSSERA